MSYSASSDSEKKSVNRDRHSVKKAARATRASSGIRIRLKLCFLEKNVSVLTRPLPLLGLRPEMVERVEEVLRSVDKFPFCSPGGIRGHFAIVQLLLQVAEAEESQVS